VKALIFKLSLKNHAKRIGLKDSVDRNGQIDSAVDESTVGMFGAAWIN
jgi:hypothetical protein